MEKVARKGETRNVYKFLVRKPNGERHSLEAPSFAGVIIKWILMKKYGKARNSFIWLRIGTNGGLL
jgi:hypothetical protein